MSLSLRKAYRFSFLSTIVFLTSTFYHTSAYAGSFEIKQQSVSGAGSAHAGIAVGTDLSSMYWNPAATANVKGTNVEQHGFGLLIKSDMRSTGTPLKDQIGDRFDGVIEGTVQDLLGNNPLSNLLGGAAAHLIDVGITDNLHNSSGDWVSDQALASVYFNHQINSKLFAGFSLNSPLGPSSTPKNKIWEGALQAKNTDIFTMEGAGTLAYKFSDKLTVGGGVRVQYMKNGNELAMPTLADQPLSLFGPNCQIAAFFKDCVGVNMTLSETASVESDSFGVGYSLGATFKPFKGTAIGIGYRSEIKHDLKGRLTAPLLIDSLPLSMDAEWEMYNPAMATASIRQRLTDKTTLLGTVQWMNWSVYNSIDIKLKPDDFLGNLATTVIGDTISEKLNWDDSWYYSVGLEHQFNNKFTGRAGVAYEVSPMQTPEQRTVRIPDADRWYFSAGGTYKYNDKLTFDFAYTYMTAEDDYKISRTDPVWGTHLDAVGNLEYHEFGLSMKYKFNTN